MADPDLQISWEGAGGGGGGHPDPEIRGAPGLPNFSFRPFGPQFGLKIKEGPLDMQFYNSRDVRRSAAHCF